MDLEQVRQWCHYEGRPYDELRSDGQDAVFKVALRAYAAGRTALEATLVSERECYAELVKAAKAYHNDLEAELARLREENAMLQSLNRAFAEDNRRLTHEIHDYLGDGEPDIEPFPDDTNPARRRSSD